MKIEKIEIKTYKEKYVAEDGTEFNDKSECEQYESSALAVLKARLKEMAIFTGSESDVFECGSEECESYVIVPQSKADIDTIRQFLAINGRNPEYIANFTDDNIGKVIIVTMTTYDHWVWWTSLNHIIDKVTNGKFGVYDKEILKGLTIKPAFN